MYTATALPFVDTPMPKSEAAAAEPAAAWSAAYRLVFRFVFAYMMLYNSLQFVELLGLHKLPLIRSCLDLWLAAGPWIGEYVLHLPNKVTLSINGSGDTTYHYLEALCLLILAALTALVWSLLDRRPRAHVHLQEVLLITLRYSLAATMLIFGFVKVFKTQFPAPSPGRLLQPYGESSPMGLLWTFMGYSTAYTVFAGLAEVLGGVLLFWRRTTTVGALLVTAVMGNVLMLNLSYDVPVKLYSAHLLAMALLVVLPDARRLTDFFVWHRPTTPGDLSWPWPERRRLRYARLALKHGLIAWLFYKEAHTSFERMVKYGDNAPKLPVYGVHEVEEFHQDGRRLNPAPWKRVSASNRSLIVRRADDVRMYFYLRSDDAKKALTLEPYPYEPGENAVLRYERPSSGSATLTGEYGKHKIYVRLRAVDTTGSLLMTRGFRWINEVPFNR